MPPGAKRLSPTAEMSIECHCIGERHEAHRESQRVDRCLRQQEFPGPPGNCPRRANVGQESSQRLQRISESLENSDFRIQRPNVSLDDRQEARDVRLLARNFPARSSGIVGRYWKKSAPREAANLGRFAQPRVDQIDPGCGEIESKETDGRHDAKKEGQVIRQRNSQRLLASMNSGPIMQKLWIATVAVLFTSGPLIAQKPPLLPERDVAAMAGELNGETAKRNLEGLARFHRQRGSRGFHEAAELVAQRLREYGLSDATILQFPADGKIFYGTQRSRPAWDAEAGELWELRAQGGNARIASYAAEPVALAEDSESADVTADLIDVGKGTTETDYAGKDLKGKIVLVSAQPGAAQDLAIGK